ncbi:MAG TPA: FAD-dependent oxidoreductase [Polyangiaceae bacterium]|jgi:phytoene dehydrogenase-like protein
MRQDVIVVGGGLGGLLCAARLARAGAHVRVIERASRVGGRALSPDVGGLPMNLGAHALYLGGPAERMLRELGVAWSGFQPRAKDAWLTDGHDVLESPVSLFSLLGASAFTMGERFGLLRFFAMLDRTRARDVAGLTATAWLDRIAPGPRARRFLEAMIRVSTYTNAPDLLAAETALRQLQSAIGPSAKGVAYIDGGWQTLVDQLHDVPVVHDQAIHVDGRVDDGRVTLASGEDLIASHVVIALPRVAALHLVGEAATASPVRAACIDMVLEAAPDRRLVFGLDEPHYFSVHTPESSSPPLRAHALRYLAPGETGVECKHLLDAWLARAVPDLRVLERRFLPEMEVASAVPSASPSVPSRASVSFVGDWTSASYVLLDAVAESAESAAQHVLAHSKAA